MNTDTHKFLMGIIALMLSPFFVQAQLLDPVTFTVAEAPDQVRAGEQFSISVQADIEGKWHLYSVNNDPDAGPYPTQFSTANPLLVITGEVRESEPSIEYDPNFDTELGWHSSSAIFTVPLAFKTDVSGSTMIDLEVMYQVCDDKSCLPPKTKSITYAVTVSGVAANPVEGTQGGGSSGAAESRSQYQAGDEASIDPASAGFGEGGIRPFSGLR